MTERTLSPAAFYIVLAMSAALLLYMLAPILTPFLFSIILAYMADPLVDKMEAKMSRLWAVICVFGALFILAIAAMLLVVPILERQVMTFINNIPVYVEKAQSMLLPWVGDNIAVGEALHQALNQMKNTSLAQWQQAGGVVAMIVKSISASGVWLLAWLGNLLLVPVVTFYLLRDWDKIVAGVHEMLPRHLEERIVSLAKESDQVLGAFLRGQLMVMLLLSLIYGAGLWLVGLDFGILIGVISGLVSFVPYLGFITGVVLAGLAAIIQFQQLAPVLLVLLVFSAGQLIESFWLTPALVGNRIGLHPIAVIFSVLAGGQLFGFFGVLLALPVAAVLMVLVRYAQKRYISGPIYSSKA